jgi:hypothetical protein
LWTFTSAVWIRRCVDDDDDDQKKKKVTFLVKLLVGPPCLCIRDAAFRHAQTPKTGYRAFGTPQCTRKFFPGGGSVLIGLGCVIAVLAKNNGRCVEVVQLIFIGCGKRLKLVRGSGRQDCASCGWEDGTRFLIKFGTVTRLTKTVDSFSHFTTVF